MILLRTSLIIVFIVCCGVSYRMSALSQNINDPSGKSGFRVLKLPEPRPSSPVSIEETLKKRRSVREYRAAPLTLAEISQLCWAAQGITDRDGYRTAPSAGALYPLEMYVVVGLGEGIGKGVYQYNPHGHELKIIAEGDFRRNLARAALGQGCVEDSAVSFVIAAVYERTTRKYGDRGIRYVFMEAGHAAQNICLQAVALDIGTVVVGAFKDDEVKRVVRMTDEERPLYIIPAGKK